MKNLLKFMSIGLVMVLVLYSQATFTQSVKAADAEDDTVEFMTQAATALKVDSYTANSTSQTWISVYVNDDDLNTTESATTTWIEKGSDGGAVTVAATVSWDLDGGDLTGLDVTGTKSDAGFNSGTNHVKAGTLVVKDGEGLQLALGSWSDTAGTFKLAAAVAVNDAANDDEVIAYYDYELQDCYAAVDSSGNDAKHNNNGGCGTGAADTEDLRVQITSSSDTTGEWLTILEVNDEGADDVTADAAIASGLFRGSIALSTDASYTAAEDDTVWVQDGDTLTVSYYKAPDADGNKGALIDSDEATIDATDPAIANVSPEDGHITDEVSPTIQFDVSDAGSGFHENVVNFGDYVALSINGCAIDDDDLGVSGYTESGFTITYSQAVNWTSNATDTNSNNTVCAGGDLAGNARTGGGFNVDDDNATSGPGNDSDGNLNSTEGDATVHGKRFSWQAVVEDIAGNSYTLGETGNHAANANTGDSDLNLRIDTVAPSASSVTAAKAWDAAAKDDVTDNSSVKITFDETVNTSTVDASDFTVTGTGVTSSTINSVTFGGTDETTDTTVYLDLAADLGPNAKPKVKLVGVIEDLAGNELKPATGDTSVTLGTGDDGVKPTISSVTLSQNLLKKSDESDLAFTSDENLTNTTAAREASGGCTCGSLVGGNTVQDTMSSAAGNREGSKFSVTLSSPKAGSGTLKQATHFSTDGIFGLVVSGRDAADNNGVGGIIEVENEDVSKYFTTAGLIARDPTAAGAADSDGQFNADTEEVALKLKKWPLADHDADGELSDSITGISVNGTAMTANQLAEYTIEMVDWTENETVSIRYDDGGPEASKLIALGDTVKISYYYVDPAQVIEIDKAGPTATFSPVDATETTDTTPSWSITWDEDEYAGDNYTTVTMTEATLTDPDGVESDVLSLLTTTDNKSFYYKPVEAMATGEWKIEVKAEDTIGNESISYDSKITVKDRSKIEVAMVPGWNLVSIPGTPADGDINTVITNSQVDTVLTYDPGVPGGWLTAVRDLETDTLVGTLTTLDAEHGYWVHTNNSDAIEVDIPGYSGGSAAVPPVISVVEGWNLIPAANLDATATSWDPDTYLAGLDWVKLKAWDAAGEDWSDVLPRSNDTVDNNGDFNDDANDTSIENGKGYWMYSKTAGVIVP